MDNHAHYFSRVIYFQTILQISRYPLLKSKKILEKEVNLFNKKNRGRNGKKELV